MDRLVRGTRAERAEAPATYEAWRAGGGPALLLAKPRTFMNASGVAVAEMLGREPVTLGALLVICDDVNLPLGRVRLRPRGSDGGHNGLLSVGEELGTTEFARLRLGVGPRAAEMTLTEFVLGEFPEGDARAVEALVERGAEAALAFARGGLEAAMREFNKE